VWWPGIITEERSVAIVHEFEYLKPKTLKEALHAVAKNRGAMLLAGGTDLVGHLKEGSVAPSLIVDIKGLRELKKIVLKGRILNVGALVTFGELMESRVIQSKFPVLTEIAGKVASVGIRNRATMVGNICSAVPCLDSGPVLLAMDAIIHVKAVRGGRMIPAKKWFLQARKTAIKPGEIVTHVSIPLPEEKGAGCYIKLGRYQGEDLAQASVFVWMGKKGQSRVAFGSVGPTPLRGTRIEKHLKGKKLDPAVLDLAKELVSEEVSPITDIRATKEYRLHMCKIMLERALLSAEARIRGNGPKYGKSLI